MSTSTKSVKTAKTRSEEMDSMTEEDFEKAEAIRDELREDGIAV
jgi:protein-arginine kinase activator protein McsA